MDGGKWGEIPAHVCSVRSQTAAWSTGAAWGAQLLPQAVGAHSQSSTSFCQENSSKLRHGPWILGFLLAHQLSRKGICQLVAEHEGICWWLPAGRTMNFVTAQLLAAFVRISQKVTNLALVPRHGGLAGFAFENKPAGQPLLAVLPRHFFLSKWFSWARWAVQAGKQLWCSGLGPPNMHRHNIWIILHDSPGTRGSPPMLLSNSQIQPYSLPPRKKGGEGGRKGHGLSFLWVI